MSSKHLKQLSYLLISVFLTLGLSLSLQSLLAAWSPPTSAPPSGNISAPLNESAADQAKLGGLGIGGNFVVSGNSSLSGNVGIGTTGPNSITALTGKVLDIGSNNAQGSLVLGNNAGGNVMYLSNSNGATGPTTYVGIGAAGVGPSFVVTGSGNVGIGTTTPGSKLVVAGNLDVGTRFQGMPAPLYGGIRIGDFGGGAQGELQFDTVSGANGYGVKFIGNAADGGLDVQYRADTQSWTNFMKFLNGNVGIGTTTPNSKLTMTFLGNAGQTGETIEVTSPVGATVLNLVDYGNLISSGSTWIKAARADGTNAFIVKGDGSVGIGTTGPTKELELHGNRGWNSNTFGMLIKNDWGPSALQIDAGTKTDAGASGVKRTAAVDFKSDGALRWGIGIHPSDNSNTGFKVWESQAGDAVRLMIDAGGNIGIGTANPQRKLHIIQDSTGTPTTVAVENINTTNGNGATLASLRGVSTGAGAVGFKEAVAILGVIEQHNNATYAGSIRFFTTNEGSSYTESMPYSKERMRIDPVGNIGIGTTSPAAKLEVSGGAIKASGGLIIETRTGSNPASPADGQIWLRTDCPGGAGC